MGLDTKVVLEQIDELMRRDAQLVARSQHKDLSDLRGMELAAVHTAILEALHRLAPPNSAYVVTAETAVKTYGIANSRLHGTLLGNLTALRHDYAAGYMKSFTELVHADLFSDFLEMAEHLLNEGYKDAAAVMVGGVLEEHLRSLCTKHGVTTDVGGRPKKLDGMNSDLAAAGAYQKLEQKSVTAWAGLRNSAAHGQYGDYSKEQVALMLQGIRDFIGRSPA